MSRSGYSEDLDNWRLIMWRGAVSRALKGKRGQAMLRELLAALDAMPEKRLIANDLVNEEGEHCALGVLGQARGMDISTIDPEDAYAVAQAFGIAYAMTKEIVYINDEHLDDYRWEIQELCGPVRPNETRNVYVRIPISNVAERRWEYMRQWVVENLNPN